MHTKAPAKFLKAVTDEQVRAAMEADGHDYSLVVDIAYEGGEPSSACYSTAQDARDELAYYLNKVALQAYYDAP